MQAGNGVEALEVLSHEWIDMIFTDINMPEMDGYTLVEEIRKNPVFEKTPIVVITSETRRRDMNNILEGKVEAILTKPFRPEDIRDYLIKLLAIEEQENAEDDDFEGVDF